MVDRIIARRLSSYAPIPCSDARDPIAGIVSLHLKLHALNVYPYVLNPQPETLKPLTLNPEP